MDEVEARTCFLDRCRRKCLRVFAGVMLVFVVVPVGVCGAMPPLGVKVEVPSFTGIRYTPRNLGDFGPRKAYVLYFFDSRSALSAIYAERISGLGHEYGGGGIQFVGLNVHRDETIINVAQFALDAGMGFAVGSDADGMVAKALGVSSTPAVVVLDSDHRLIYRGSIDDQYALGRVLERPERRHLREVLAGINAGDAVEVSETRVLGCAIEGAGPGAAEGTVTYQQLAPIIEKNCVPCHHRTGPAPFSLEGYANVAGRAQIIREVVTLGSMPPWYAHSGSGEFANARGLQEEERELFRRWVDGGREEGGAVEAGEVEKHTADEWTTAPDLIIPGSEPQKLPATGYIPYRFVSCDYEFSHDTFVESLEFRFSNARVMHHAWLFYEGDDGAPVVIDGAAPGLTPTILPPRTGILIPKGARLMLQIHYVTTGKEEVDHPSVGLRYCRGPVDKLLGCIVLDDDKFSIPPRVEHHEIRISQEVPFGITVCALVSHMHLRGKDMQFLAHLPGGETQRLLSIPNYNFNWQHRYGIEPGALKLPKGTRLEAIAHFDNSEFNPHNPDPDATVVDGEQTVDEMCQAFFFYTKDDEQLGLMVDAATGAAMGKV